MADEHFDDREELDGDPQDAELRRLTDALPREIQPARDLWPGVKRAIERDGEASEGVRDARWHRLARSFGFLGLSGRPTWTTVAAAAVVVAVISSVVTQQVVRSRPVPQRAGSTQEIAVFAALESIRAECDRARRELESAFHHEGAGVPLQALEVMRANFSIIDAAIAESQAALHADPENIHLARNLTRDYENQLDLIRKASWLYAETAAPEVTDEPAGKERT